MGHGELQQAGILRTGGFSHKNVGALNSKQDLGRWQRGQGRAGQAGGAALAAARGVGLPKAGGPAHPSPGDPRGPCRWRAGGRLSLQGLGRAAWQLRAPAARRGLSHSRSGRVPRPPLPSPHPLPLGTPRCRQRDPALALPAPLHLAAAPQHPAHDCHQAKGHSCRATARSLLGQNQPRMGCSAWKERGSAATQPQRSCLVTAATAPASVSPPGQGELLPGLALPRGARLPQPLRPPTGPRRHSLSTGAAPLLAGGLGQQIAAQLRQALRNAGFSAFPPHEPGRGRPETWCLPSLAPWGRPCWEPGGHQADQEPAPGPPAKQPPASGCRRQSIPSGSHPSPLPWGEMGGCWAPSMKATGAYWSSSS